MTAKAFMLRVQQAERELKLLGARRRHYEDLMVAIGANTGKPMIGKPSGASKTETAAIGLVFITEQLVAKEQEYVSLVKKAEELISKLQQDKFKKVLTLRYLCDWSWKSIRDEMEYNDEKSVFRCHGFALKELQKLL